MKEKPITYSLNEVEQVVGEQVLPLLLTYRIFTFEGFLGAGKTTLIKAFAKALGVEEPVTSPTFTYVNVYGAPEGVRLYHFDLYRVEGIEQFIEAGLDEDLRDERGICLIEWPTIIEPLLKEEFPGQVCSIAIAHIAHDPSHRAMVIGT